MSESEQSNKAVEGGVDELLLGDGFSIVDSTNNIKTEPEHKPEPKAEEAKAEPAPKPDAVVKKEEEPEKAPQEVKKVQREESSSNKVNGHDTKSDALLITTEEDLDLNTGDKDKEKKTDEEEDKKRQKDAKSTKGRNDKRKSGDVWVSNITRSVKATDLKKHFSKFGKVLTAKIVTNGRSFFGYILMENGDVANKCVRALNSTQMDGRKIFVCRQRPDAQRNKSPELGTSVKVDKKNDKKESTVPTTTTTTSPAAAAKDEKKDEKEAKKDNTIRILRRSEDKLKRDNEFLRREVARLKRFIADEQRRRRNEENKTRTLGRELQEAESKLKEERRKFDRDRELYEKNSRTDRTRLDSDRSLIKKELEEVKKLREYLKRKIDEEQSRSAEQRRSRASSPYAYSSKRFRGSDNEKSSKYVEVRTRTRTPPSPPKLSSRKRSPADHFHQDTKDRRSYHDLNDSRDDNGSSGGRHGHTGSSIVIQAKPAVPAPPRNIWTSAFHQEVWRMPPSAGATATPPFVTSNQSSFSRQSDYGGSTQSSGGNKGAGYSQTSSARDSRDFSSKRDHYSGSGSSSSIRKY